MSSGGDQSTFLLTGAGDVLGDIGGFITGPPGDPGRIRQIAEMVDALTAEYRRASLTLDDAVITLTQSWTGTAATSFRGAWTAGTRGSPSTVLSTLGDNLVAFSRELRDYADELEHAQNEHWIQLGLMAALTVLNAAQGGADPATDAAEVAAGAGLEVAAGVSLTGLGELALGALSGFGSDVLSQFGADLLDRTGPGFDQTGDDVVPVLNRPGFHRGSGYWVARHGGRLLIIVRGLDLSRRAHAELGVKAPVVEPVEVSRVAYSSRLARSRGRLSGWGHLERPLRLGGGDAAGAAPDPTEVTRRRRRVARWSEWPDIAHRDPNGAGGPQVPRRAAPRWPSPGRIQGPVGPQRPEACQPTTRREKTSTMKATKTQPEWVLT